MSSEHDHGHGQGHGLSAPTVNAGARYERPPTVAVLLTVACVGVEVAVGTASGSLALRSDVRGLGMSLAAIGLATALLSVAQNVNTLSLVSPFRTRC